MNTRDSFYNSLKLSSFGYSASEVPGGNFNVRVLGSLSTIASPRVCPAAFLVTVNNYLEGGRTCLTHGLAEIHKSSRHGRKSGQWAWIAANARISVGLKTESQRSPGSLLSLFVFKLDSEPL